MTLKHNYFRNYFVPGFLLFGHHLLRRTFVPSVLNAAKQLLMPMLQLHYIAINILCVNKSDPARIFYIKVHHFTQLRASVVQYLLKHFIHIIYPECNMAKVLRFAAAGRLSSL